MSIKVKVAPQRLLESLRARVVRVLVAVLVGTLFVPMIEMSVPALREQAAAAVSNGSITLSTAGKAEIAWAAQFAHNGGSTWEAWVRLDSVASSNRIFGPGSGSLGSQLFLDWQSNGNMNWLPSTMSGNCTNRPSGVTPVAGIWYHIAFVIPAFVNTQTYTSSVFINGVSAATCSTSLRSNGRWTSISLGGSTGQQITYGPIRLSGSQRYTGTFIPPIVYPTSYDSSVLTQFNTPYDSDDSANSCLTPTVPTQWGGESSLTISSGTKTCGQSAPASPVLCSAGGWVKINSAVSTTSYSCVGSVDLSNTGLTELNGTFKNLTNVTEVTLPNTLQIISGEAFLNTGIAKLVLPPSITLICEGCIASNARLTSVEMSGSPSVPVTFGNKTFQNNPVLERVSFGYSADTSLNLTSYTSSATFMFQGNPRLTTVNSCAAPASYLATFLAGVNASDTANPQRVNTFNGTTYPTVGCDNGDAITGGGTTVSGDWHTIRNFTATLSGTSVTLSTTGINSSPVSVIARSISVSTDNRSFTDVCYQTVSSYAGFSCTATGLTSAETYYFRLSWFGNNGYNSVYSPDITVTMPIISSVATLSNLTLSSGTLSTTFNRATETYTASVANAVDSVTVTATKSDSGASIVQYLGETGTTVFNGALAVGANVIRTVVTAGDQSTKKTYTVTITRAASTVATLSALAASAGTLSTTFASGTETYTVSVANSVLSTTITPTRTQANATITVNGTSVPSGNASGAIALSVGPNIITVLVTAQDGSTTKTYTVTVTRATSTVATLSSLTLSTGTLSQGFTSSIETYTASVANSIETISVTATPTQANATITVNGTSVPSGNASGAIALSVGPNIITVLVTAQDGSTTKTYTVTVTRATSTVATLSSLTLSTGTLSQGFTSSIETYTASVANSIETISVTATPTQANATMVQYLGPTGDVLFTGALSVGANVIRTVVTAQDGLTKKTYTVTVTRLSNDARLSALVLPGVSLSPGFDSATESYTASVANATTRITVTPTRFQANATITVNGTSVTSGSASGSIALNVGSNIITVVVTAQDGTTRTYTVTVTRAASAVATLSNLTLSSGSLNSSFASTTETYTASVGNAVSSITLTPTVTQANATITVNGAAVTSGSASGSIALNVGPNIITVVVTAQDGTTTKNYTVTVTRISNDATLSALVPSAGTLSPTFTSATETYTATVGNAVSSITITPTVTQANATTVQYIGATGTTAFTGALAVGANVIRTVVTAQDGTTTKTYTVTVTRVSNDATLSALVPSAGTLSPTFASLTESYTATVGHSQSTITITPTRTQTNATITVNGIAVTSGSASGSIALSVGPNIITVVVSAQDGTTKTYTVTVTREQPKIVYRHNNCYPGSFLSGSCLGDTPTTPISTTDMCTPGSSYTILGSSANTQSAPTVSSRGSTASTYTFNGWNTTNNGGGVRYLPGSTITCTEDLRIYVQWSNYSINFNTGFGGPTVASVPIDPNLFLSALAVPTATKPNWTFRGWTRAWGVGSSNAESIPTGGFRANLSELGSERNGPDVFISDYTLCAKWANALEFDGQGATTTPTAFKCAQGYETGTAVTIPSAEPTKTNATFGGWYTGMNGAGTKVTGNSFTPAAPYGVQTLYAYWLGVKFDPTFGIPTRTADGFVISTTNYNAAFIWDSATVTSGSGSVSAQIVNNQVQLTVRGMSPGSLSTISLKTSRAGYVDGTGVATGQALEAAWQIVISDIVRSTSGFTASVNYNQDYQWSVSSSLGSAAINSQGKITVANVEPLTPVTVTVSAARTGYATDIETATAITLERLRVTYDRNTASGGSVPADSKQYLSNETATVLGNIGADALTLLGKKFEGWTLNSNGTGRIYKAGEILQLSSSGVTLYANWSLLPYFVTYQSNGATSGTVPEDRDAQGARTIYTIGQSVPVYGNTGGLARTGYTFIGWGQNATDTQNLYKSGDSYTVGSGDIAFWARWSADTYTVTFDANGATGSPSKSVDYYTTAGTPITLATIGSMQEIGYNFIGWGTSPVSTPVSDSYTVTSHVTLYAQWRIANYSVTYLAGNNGSGTLPTQVNVNYGATFSIAAATGLTASDAQGSYAFVSWSDSTRTYAPGQSYVMGTSAVTLTAQWTRIYNVTYSYNGGSVASPIADQQKIAGDTVTVSSTIPTRAGYTFLNWIDQAGETTTPGSTYTVRDNHYLLYAQWSATLYSVTYDSNGGTAVPAEPSHTIDQIFTLATAPTKTGHNFAHWSDGANNYNAGTDYKVGTSNIVLQAQWIAQVYQISYNFNGGTGAPISNTSYTFGTAAATLPSTGISRTDFTFSGWSTSTTATTGVYSFTPSGNIQLHAVWVSSVYRLNFDAMSGFSDSASAKVTIGQSLILPEATRANHTLQGWSTQQSGGALVAGGTSYTPSANGTLYAQWALQVFTVTYNANQGSVARNSDSMTYGSSSPITLPTATRLNYVFDGWYSATSGGYLIGAAGASYAPTTSLTVYAQWTQLSLYGMGDATQIAQITVQANTDSSFTAGSNGSTATVSYLANSLPVGTVITAYVENSVSRVTSLITVASAPVLSLIIAWVAPDGTVPDTESGTAITLTVFNSSIKAGSKVFGLLGNNKDVLGTATVDGQVQVSISKDPAVVVAKVGPDAPTNVVSTATGETSAMISWTAPAINGGSEITEYIATASSGQSCRTSTTSCLITGLTPGASLTFSVVASNAIGGGSATTPTPTLTLARAQVTENPAVVVNPEPVTIAPVTTVVVDNSAELKAAQEKAAAEAKAAAELKDAEEKAAADLRAAELRAAEQKAAELKAAELKAAEEKAAAELKAAEEKAAAEAKATADAAAAAALAAKKITPAVSLYSISPKLTLSAYDLAYLKKYLSTLKKTATVTCIGYTYTQNTTLAKATALAKKQASAVCSIVKKTKPTLKTSILIRPAKSAPKAAVGAKWVAISYRVDGFQPKK